MAFGPGELRAYMRAGRDLNQDIDIYIETVHRLNNVGALITYAAHETSQQGFDAEWRGIAVLTVEGDLVSRSEVFDEADLENAKARFDQLTRSAQRPENAASQRAERLLACFHARDWEPMAEMLRDDSSIDDRRRTVNGGVRYGRDAEIEDLRAAADVGFTRLTSTVIATRGERLILTLLGGSGRDPEAIQIDALHVVEIDAEGRIATVVVFDLDDIDAAIAELDPRYLAGEASTHSHTWSVIAGAFAALNRRQLPPTTPDWRSIDHRRIGTIESNALTANIGAFWEITSESRIDIEAVHRLTKFGSVVTHATHATSQEGLGVESREISMLMVEGNRINRCELFDGTDIDGALARFDELHQPTRHLENAATRVYERLQSYYSARDWGATTEILSDDHYSDDRRRVVNAGIRHGRDIEIANMKTAVGLGTKNITSVVVATRGERLALNRSNFSGRDQRPEAFHTEVLNIVEIDADERIKAFVTFDVNDIDAAFEELDARYLAGEAAAPARTWSLVAQTCAALNRGEFASTTPDFVNIDHRRGTGFSPGDLEAFIRTGWDFAPSRRIYVEAVHRLSDFGTVFTAAAYGTSQEGFDAEWRMIALGTVEGDLFNRCEIFDESDLDAALARFEELRQQTPRMGNAASRVAQRYQACFAARDWAAMAELLADDIVTDDRRRVVNAGLRYGRDVNIADTRTAAEIGAEKATSSFIAIRGERLALARVRSFNRGFPRDEFVAETIGIVEIDTDNRIEAIVMFDLDDIDAAFEELETRYLAGEAAAHAHTWSLVAGIYAGFNRHELPATTPDFVSVDHRPLITIETADLPASIRAIWDLTPDLHIYIEAVHRLSRLGAVVTHTARGVSQEGFDAEWRMIFIYTVQGEMISRSELFDEPDIDAALARFDEIGRSA